MQENDWREIIEKHLDACRRRVVLVEMLLDENIDEVDRLLERSRYIEEEGVSERMVRNYLFLYRE